MKQFKNLLTLRVYQGEETQLFDKEVTVAMVAKVLTIELAKPTLFRWMCENMYERGDVAELLNFDPDADEPARKDPYDGTTASERLKGLPEAELQWIKRHGRTRLMSSSIGEGDPARFPEGEELDLIFSLSAPPEKEEAEQSAEG